MELKARNCSSVFVSRKRFRDSTFTFDKVNVIAYGAAEDL